MKLDYRSQLIIACTQSIIEKYGFLLTMEDFAKILEIEIGTLKNKISSLQDNLPKYTQIRGKRVFMASDIAEWMVLNNMKFPQ